MSWHLTSLACITCWECPQCCDTTVLYKIRKIAGTCPGCFSHDVWIRKVVGRFAREFRTLWNNFSSVIFNLYILLHISELYSIKCAKWLWHESSMQIRLESVLNAFYQHIDVIGELLTALDSPSRLLIFHWTEYDTQCCGTMCCLIKQIINKQ